MDAFSAIKQLQHQDENLQKQYDNIRKEKAQEAFFQKYLEKLGATHLN